jgi:hypothetical protein
MPTTSWVMLFGAMAAAAGAIVFFIVRLVTG